MKNYKYYILSLLFTSMSLVSTAQVSNDVDIEEVEEIKEDVIIDTKGLKVVLKEKNTEVITTEDGDTVTRKTETVEITTSRSEGDEEVGSLSDIKKYIKKEIKEEGGVKEIEFIETEWNNFHLGLNNLLNKDNKLEPESGYAKMKISPSKSFNFQWDIVSQAMNLYKGKVRLVYGIGIDFNNYRFENDITLNTDSIPLMIIDDAVNYDKNKLVTKHLNVPLMINFNLSPRGAKEKVYISAGANFGYLIGSHQKQKWNDNGKKKNKIEDDYNLQQFRVGYEMQFGYKNVVLFGKYFPESIFKANQGPELRTVSAGILIGKV